MLAVTLPYKLAQVLPKSSVVWAPFICVGKCIPLCLQESSIYIVFFQSHKAWTSLFKSILRLCFQGLSPFSVRLLLEFFQLFYVICFSKQVEVFVMLSRVKGLLCLFSIAVTFHGSFRALMLPDSWCPLQIFMVDCLQPKLCFAHNLIQLHLRLLNVS